MTCAEVRALRLLTSEADPVKDAAVRRLARKYAAGRRSAVDVCQGLDALRAHRHLRHLQTLALDCLEVVEPIPSALWTWCCANAGLLPCHALRHMLAIAADPDTARYARHLLGHAAELLSTPDGLAAALHELRRFPQIADAVGAAVADLLPARGCGSCGPGAAHKPAGRGARAPEP